MNQHKRIAGFLLVALLAMGLAVPSFGQKAGVSGKVTDNTGAPIPGAFVQEKGTQNAALTDADGAYSLKVAPNATLVFQNLGFLTQEVSAAGKAVVNVTLLEDVTLLNEAVAIGYGTLEKKMLTSSVSSVSGQALMPGKSNTSVAAALKGKVAGLSVNASDAANAGASLQLRGVASVNAGSSPLIVIDGNPGGSLDAIIPEDVLSIDVLKDAAAGAIYGSRAAGGVILVTTKNAGRLQEGTTSVSYSAELSTRTELDEPIAINAEQFREYYRKDFPQTADYGGNDDWWEAMVNRDNLSQKHTLNFQANSKKSDIYASLQYNSNEGFMKYDERTDVLGKINANLHLLDGWLDLGMKVNYLNRKSVNHPYDPSSLFSNPTRPIYDETTTDGFAFDNLSNYNYIRENYYIDSWSVGTTLNAEADLKLNILPVEGLSYNQVFNYARGTGNSFYYDDANSWTSQNQGIRGSAQLGSSFSWNYSFEGYFNYLKNWGSHNLNATAGYSYLQSDGISMNMRNSDFGTNTAKYYDMSTGSYLSKGTAGMGSGRSITGKVLSYFARANYDYAGKYILMASLRREASSKFSRANRWGTFWSVSGGWRMSAEDWMKDIEWISDLKLRASYGVTGNNSFSDSYATTMYTSDSKYMMPTGVWGTSYIPNVNTNPALKWEEQRGLNFGIDFAFFDNRLYGKFDNFKRKVVDLLFNVHVPQPPYVHDTMMMNIGSLENVGWEFELGGDVVRTSKVRYSTTLRLSHEKTTLVSLGEDGTYMDMGGVPLRGASNSAQRLEAGGQIGRFYILHCTGIDEKTGDYLIESADGTIVQGQQSCLDDRQYLGNFVPKLQLSMDHRLSVGNFDFAVDLRSWLDYDVLNTIDMGYGHRFYGSMTTMAAYTKNYAITQSYQVCDYYLEDASFLKIDAIYAAYNIPIKKATKNFVKGLKVYGSINNPTTFTKYSGVDPEVGVNGLSGGIETSTYYPRLTTYILGASINF